jgi:hypothetical protein
VLKKLSLLVALVFWAHSSYSESITPYGGQTGNAAAGGNTWSMGSVLPEPPGLSINGVIYNYTIRKNVDDSVTVNVQNENALGPGYIFRETDRWLPGSLDGTEINKVVPVNPGIHRSHWGDGSIEVDGNGSVDNPTVLYTYTVDPCYDPQFDPNCPGYQVQVPDIYQINLDDIYNPLEDENIDFDRQTCKQGDTSAECQAILEEADEGKSEEELAEEEEKEKEEREMRLEDALAEAGRSVMFATALAQSQMLAAANAATNMNSYYTATIPGGTYKDNVVLVDKQLPENRRGLRNGLAQQLLHQQMVESQYK